MIKTSATNPLEIAAVSAGSTFGRVGITFCPGKHDLHAMTGSWDRDLSVDLDAIRNWGAAAVVTLAVVTAIHTVRVTSQSPEPNRTSMIPNSPAGRSIPQRPS